MMTERNQKPKAPEPEPSVGKRPPETAEEAGGDGGNAESPRWQRDHHHSSGKPVGTLKLKP